MRIFLSLATVLLCCTLSAQRINHSGKITNRPVAPNHLHCGTDSVMNLLRANDPDFEQKAIEREQILQEWIDNNYEDWKAKRALITIPVVVQLWVSSSVIPDAVVYEQLNVLNKDFRRQNSDANNTPAVFESVAADCEIEFCLATIDPQGNPTTGIIRHTGSTEPNANDELWDAGSYLNIYVYHISTGELGFTVLPSSPNHAVHIDDNNFGITGMQSPYNGGRTTTHEVGHWFDLLHMWGSFNCGDDLVSDTPPQQGPNGGCQVHPFNVGGCSGNTDGEMFMNYMDYSNDNCLNVFTEGQKARMIAAINTFRPSLLSSQGCPNGGPSPTANFTASANIIGTGQYVHFTDQSSGIANSGWTYSWSFPGGNPASSLELNPDSIQYNSPGIYNVTLVIDSGSTTSTELKTGYITVLDANVSQSCDTLNWPFSGTRSVYTTEASDACGTGGYIAGRNAYCDLAKVDFFDNYGNFNYITGALIGFSTAYNATGSGSAEVTVWDNSGSNSAPGVEAQSINVPLNSIANDITNGEYTVVTFDQSIPIVSDFYLGVEIDNSTGDTIAVYTNFDGEANPNVSWEKQIDGTWSSYTSAWALDIAHDIHPIVCTIPNTTPPVTLADGMNVFPNPTSGIFHLEVLEKGVEVQISDVTGKIIFSGEYDDSHLIELDLSTQTNGVYFVSVKSANHNVTKRILRIE